MGRISEITDRIKSYFDYLFKTGFGADRAYRTLRDQTITEEKIQNYPSRSKVRDYFRTLRSESARTAREMPSKRSDWMYADLATPTNFLSKKGYRYLVDIEFQAWNKDEEKWQTVVKTMGLDRTMRRGEILDRALNLARVVVDNPELYQEKQLTELNEDSINIRAFYRTLN